MKYLLLVLALTFTACATAPPNLTPQAHFAFYAHQSQTALDQVRDVTQSAATFGAVSQKTANDVTAWHLAAINAIHAGTAGWEAAVATSLQEVVKTLPPSDAAVIRPYVTLALGLLQEIHR